MSWIYKIVTDAEWRAFEDAGRFDGSALDRSDGYIHFSTMDQVADTLAKHYAGREGLWLLAIESDRLDDAALRYEAARGGQLFPHLYDALGLDAVSRQWPLTLDAAGRHSLPDLAA